MGTARVKRGCIRLKALQLFFFFFLLAEELRAFGETLGRGRKCYSNKMMIASGLLGWSSGAGEKLSVIMTYFKKLIDPQMLHSIIPLLFFYTFDS